MSKLKIPHDAFILVGDGRKALFLRNDGDEKFPNLKVERVEQQENPPTSAQGTDKPSLVQGGDGRVGGVGQTDWHDLGEKNFARDIAARLQDVVRERGVKSVIVVAPARTLAELRTAFHDEVRKKIVAEIDKDLTKHPVHEIEKHLTAK